MTQDPATHERITQVESRLSDVERRLRALEGRSPEQAGAADHSIAEPVLGGGIVANAATHLGRALLIGGGAYLLRAITDFQFVPTGVGLFLGAAYAVFWLYMCFRIARVNSQRSNAVILGGISVVLILPLLAEAVSRFQLLSGPQSMMALAVYYALVMAVAVTRDLRSLAWLVTAGGIVTAVTIMIGSHAAAAVTLFLIVVGIATLWTDYLQDWIGLQWLGALGADAAVAAFVVLGASERWSIEPALAATFGAILLLTYFMSFAYRSHIERREMGVFEALQGTAVILVAFWAASVAAHAGQFGFRQIGIVSGVLGVCSYGLAFSRATRSVRGRNFFFYSTLALLLVLAGSGLILPPEGAAALWSLMALALAWFSGRSGWVTLSLQCTLLLIAAADQSGILTMGSQAFAGDAAADWPPLQISHLGVAAATVACLFIPVAQYSERWGVLAGLPQLIVLALSVWEVGGLIVLLLAPMLAEAGRAGANLAILAALRTVVLAAASVTLALSSRHRRWPEARWLAYPVLVIVGIKLFVEDFPSGQPATLFVALAFVGAALLLVSRLIRREGTHSAG